jgi:queuine tRNA-ribosyltransferase
VALPATPAEMRTAVMRSLAWAERSKKAFARYRDEGIAGPGQALFGIVQGGTDAGLRQLSADGLVAMDIPGYAVGGLAVGEPQEVMLETLALTTTRLPADKPRYLMGVGTPLDLIEAVARGIDMFDCVLPTRSGRHGQAFTWTGKVNLRNARHADDGSPLDPGSTCPAARDYSRAYLHHLVKSGEYLGAMLLSWANTAFYQDLMLAMRAAIDAGRFAAWSRETKARLQQEHC